jgi:hypothetical protein
VVCRGAITIHVRAFDAHYRNEPWSKIIVSENPKEWRIKFNFVELTGLLDPSATAQGKISWTLRHPSLDFFQAPWKIKHPSTAPAQ